MIKFFFRPWASWFDALVILSSVIVQDQCGWAAWLIYMVVMSLFSARVSSDLTPRH